MIRGILIVVGTLCVILGVVGIFVPLLPTTPFLLLAAACYARSSERLQRWLHGNRWFGAYLRDYQEGRGVPWAAKVSAIILIWASMAVSAFWLVPPRCWWAYVLLLFVASAVTVYLLRLKGCRRT